MSDRQLRSLGKLILLGVLLGVGLYLHGELRSQIPKGRRREL